MNLNKEESDLIDIIRQRFRSSSILYTGYKDALKSEGNQNKKEVFSGKSYVGFYDPSEDVKDRIEPMDTSLKNQFERAFGADFSIVTIHTGAKAESLTRGAGASAITIGSDIYFAGGRYAPQTEEGIQLLAHELQHVIQGLKGSRMVYVEDIEGLENEAERVEDLINEDGLHNLDTMALRQKGPFSGGTGYHSEESKGLFKKPGSNSVDSLDDFNSKPEIPVYVVTLKGGEKVILSREEYDGLINRTVHEIKEWVSEETIIADSSNSDRLNLGFQKWVSGGHN